MVVPVELVPAGELTQAARVTLLRLVRSLMIFMIIWKQNAFHILSELTKIFFLLYGKFRRRRRSYVIRAG